MLGGFTASYTVGLVVEYAPATGETRVRFPDGVVQTTKWNVHFLFQGLAVFYVFATYTFPLPVNEGFVVGFYLANNFERGNLPPHLSFYKSKLLSTLRLGQIQVNADAWRSIKRCQLEFHFGAWFCPESHPCKKKSFPFFKLYSNSRLIRKSSYPCFSWLLKITKNNGVQLAHYFSLSPLVSS